MGFHAVFIGTGAGYPSFMGIPGESLNGVLSANELLTRCNLMRARDYPNFDTPLKPGKHVAVIGAGNTAMDALRVSLRLGAESVHCIYRRSHKEAPARAEEIHHAEEEGVDFNWLSSPVEILGDENKSVRALRCIKMELGEPDASGRRRPVPVPGSEFEFEVDMVVFAIGTNANPILGQTAKLKLDKRGYIATDENLATSIVGVFAGGDIVTGAATVIEAMGAGRKAARSMKAWLGLRDTESVYEAATVGHPLRHSLRRARLRARAPRLGLFQQPPTVLQRLHHDRRRTYLDRPAPTAARAARKRAKILTEHIVEVISDSGEGAQRCGQSLGRDRRTQRQRHLDGGDHSGRDPAAGAQRRGRLRHPDPDRAHRVTNGGDETDLVVAFNEQVLLGRVRAGELKPGATILLESMWREHKDPTIVASYEATVTIAEGERIPRLRDSARARVPRADDRRAPRQEHVRARHAVQHLQPRPAARARPGRAVSSARRTQKVIATNVQAPRRRLRLGRGEPRLQVRDPRASARRKRRSSSTATPRSRSACSRRGWTSARCIRSRQRPRRRITCPTCSSASAASSTRPKTRSPRARSRSARRTPGTCAVTITSGPGYSLKQEGLGLAVMAEIPLVVVNVQRGGPMHGQPTKVEQGDLLATIFGSHGDAPKVVLAVSATSRTASIR